MLTELRHRVIVAGVACTAFACVFTAFLLLERPGLGIGHFFYVPVLLLGLAGTTGIGIAGGLAATALYSAGVILNPSIPPTEVPTVSSAIRLVTYVMVGAGFGWFASRSRESHRRLLTMAERDFLTGVGNVRAFDRAMRRHVEARRPFALLIGDLDSLKRLNDERGHPEGDLALRRAAEVLTAATRPEDDVARIGGDEFAVLTAGAQAERLATRLEADTAAAGTPLTFGWALCPTDGEDAMALYRAADERLYMRKGAASAQKSDVVRA